MKCPTEHAEQVTFVNWFERTYPGVRIFAIPNGGLRHTATAQKLKQEGVRKGVPDLYIPEWRTWVEMKRVKGGSVSRDQKDWIAYLESIGDTVIIGKGWQDARSRIEALRHD